MALRHTPVPDLNDLAATFHNAPVAFVLLGAIAVVSGLALTKAPWLIDRCLLRPYWLVRRQQWATLVSCGFVHADFGHLFFNGFTFWAFGFSLERVMGSPRFAALYLTGLLASSAGTWLRHREEPAYASLGASGAILAVLFASIVYTPTQSIFILPIPVPIPAPWFALGYLAYSIWAARQARGRVNHDAHLVGALAGVVFVAVTDPEVLSRAVNRLVG